MQTLISPPATATSGGAITHTGKELSNQFFSSLPLFADGADGPGIFSDFIKFAGRYGGTIGDARGSTLGMRFQWSMIVHGTSESLKFLEIQAESHHLFPKIRPEFALQESPPAADPCTRYELYVEAVDDGQIAEVCELAGAYFLNIASMEIRRICSPFSGEHVAAEFRLGTEVLLDVCDDQTGALSQFKADLVHINADDGLIKIWDLIQEGEPGTRPDWKLARARR